MTCRARMTYADGVLTMTVEDHSSAGQGPVLLDIGGDIGALIVTMPAALQGAEIEIRPLDGPARHDHLRHVGVLGRPVAGGVRHCAVFGEVREGSYELYLRSDGEVRLRVAVRGGAVTEAVWPDSRMDPRPPPDGAWVGDPSAQ